jgi:hypothetical protein
VTSTVGIRQRDRAARRAQIEGDGFTPGGTVDILTFDPSGTGSLLSFQSATATTTTTRLSCRLLDGHITCRNVLATGGAQVDVSNTLNASVTCNGDSYEGIDLTTGASGAEYFDCPFH